MADVFEIAGTPLDLTTDDFIPVRFSERFGAIPTLTIQRRGVALGALPEPWMGKEVTWEHDGTLYFTGDVVSVSPTYSNQVGWILTYQCLGWRNRLDWIPHTDENTGTDTSTYNLPLDDPSYNAAKAGRTVGQILTDILTMQDNADAIDAAGLGGYTSLSPPTLPAATVTDLAALTIIPQRPVYFSGEKFGNALEGFVSTYAPNHRWWVDPDGVFWFKDLRTFTPQTLTMGTDPIEPTELSRDVGDCFQRVVGRGMPIAVMAVLKLSDGALTEEFVWGGHANNAAAKAAWTPADFSQPGAAQDTGDANCTSTNTIELTSDDAALTWGANDWDQSNRQGVVNFSSTIITDYTQFWSSRIIANDAMTAGNPAEVTIDNPLPHTDFDRYTLTGLATDGSIVWTQYQIANTDLWERVTKQSTYPQPFINSGGGTTMISTPMGAVIWSASGNPPFNSFPLQFTYNASTGMVRFIAPTYIIANNHPPDDVWVAVPVQTNPNTAIQPPDSGGPVYSGTSHTVDGLEKTLTIDLPYWRDPGQLAQVNDYLEDILDSVKDAVVEGSVVYYGSYPDALTFGLALHIEGDDGDGVYDTMGWDGITLPVVQVDVEWPQAEGMDMRFSMHVSNRRAHLGAEMFLHPERTFLELGMESSPFDMENAVIGTFETPMDFIASSLPGMTDMPTSPEEYFQSQGMATNPEDYLRSIGAPVDVSDMGLPTSPADIGLPTTPGEFLQGQGLPTDPSQMFGGGAQNGAAANGNAFMEGEAAAPPEPPVAEPPPAPEPPAPPMVISDEVMNEFMGDEE